MLTSLDHVQIAMPAGEEDAVRAFCIDLLELEEIPKPENLAARGGVWFELPDGRQIHYGVEANFAPARKAHPAFIVAELSTLASRLSKAGHPILWDDELAPRRRFYAPDPFGNRIEFLEPE